MTDETKKPTKQSDADTLAYYRVINDAYVQKFKFRSWVFNRILNHMMNNMKEESTIFYLMQEIQKNKKVSK